MKKMKKILSIAEVADRLSVSCEDVKDFVKCGDLIAVGSNKNFVKLCDFNSFLGEEPPTTQTGVRPLDNIADIALHSIQNMTADVNEEDFDMAVLEHGEGSVYWHEKRKCFQAAFYLVMPNGNKQRKIVSGATEIEAIGKMGAVQATQAMQGKIIDNSFIGYPIQQNVSQAVKKYTINEVVKDFIIEKNLTCEVSTSEWYQYSCIPIQEKFGERYIDEIKAFEINNFLQEKAVKKNGKMASQSAVVAYKKAFNGLFNKAIDMEYIPDNSSPMGRVKLPKAVKVTDPNSRFLSMKQIEILLNAIKKNERYTFIVKILVGTGLRIGELCGLMWSDIDFEKRIIHVNRALKKNRDFVPLDENNPKYILGKTKTLASLRDVVVSQKTIELLQNWKKSTGSDSMVLLNEDGNTINYETLRRKFSEYIEKCGIKKQFNVTFHMLRHTFGSILLENGVELVVVSRLLGHSSIEITADIYVKVTDKLKYESIAKMDSVLTALDNMSNYDNC